MQEEFDSSRPTFVDSLPDELLASIMRLLPWQERVLSLELVSKRWNRVVKRDGYSDRIEFDNEDWEYRGIQGHEDVGYIMED